MVKRGTYVGGKGDSPKRSVGVRRLLASMVSRFAIGAKIAFLALPLAAGLIFGSLLALHTLHWGTVFVLWQLFWWLFVSLAVGVITFLAAGVILRDIRAHLDDLDLDRIAIAFNGSLVLGELFKTLSYGANLSVAPHLKKSRDTPRLVIKEQRLS